MLLTAGQTMFSCDWCRLGQPKLQIRSMVIHGPSHEIHHGASTCHWRRKRQIFGALNTRGRDMTTTCNNLNFCLFTKQRSLYYQPKQCTIYYICTIIGEISQNYHIFAFFDHPKWVIQCPLPKAYHQTSWWLNPAIWNILKHSQIGSWNPKVWGEHKNYMWNLHPANHVVSLLFFSYSHHSKFTSILCHLSTTGPHLPSPSDATCKKRVAVSTNAMKGNESLLLHTGGM